jgi:hypothetical protein
VDGKQKLELIEDTKLAPATGVSNNSNPPHTVSTDQDVKVIEPELYGEF